MTCAMCECVHFHLRWAAFTKHSKEIPGGGHEIVLFTLEESVECFPTTLAVHIYKPCQSYKSFK